MTDTIEHGRQQALESLDRDLASFNFGTNTGSALIISNADARRRGLPEVDIGQTSKIAKAELQKAQLKRQGVDSIVNQRTGNITIISSSNQQGLTQAESASKKLLEGLATARNNLLGFGRNRPNTSTRDEFLSRNQTPTKPRSEVKSGGIQDVITATIISPSGESSEETSRSSGSSEEVVKSEGSNTVTTIKEIIERVQNPAPPSRAGGVPTESGFNFQVLLIPALAIGGAILAMRFLK